MQILLKLFIWFCNTNEDLCVCVFFLILRTGISKMFSRVPINPNSDLSATVTDQNVPSLASATTNSAVTPDDQPGKWKLISQKP